MIDFCKFIENNKELVHLDISNSQVQEQMLRRIVDAVATSQSLMAVHFCGNPGLTPEFTQYCQDVLGCGRPAAPI